MIKVNEKFRDFCIMTFGEKDGDFVYEFYRDFFNYTRFKREGVYKSLSRTDKTANINYLVNKAGREKFLECIKYFKNNWESGTLPTHSIRYFTTVAENFKPKEDCKYAFSKKDSYLDKKEINIVTPKRFKKVRQNMDLDFLNYDYQCTCGNIIDAWTTECKQCGSSISWKNA